MSTTNERGIGFSVDLMIAFLVMLTMLYFIFVNFDAFAEKSANSANEIALEKNAFYFADSMVKNGDANGIWNRIAYFDDARRRVLSNNLDKDAFGIIGNELWEFENSEFFARKIYVIYKDGGEEILFESGKEAVNCVGTERFVIVGERKALLGVVVCNE